MDDPRTHPWPPPARRRRRRRAAVAAIVLVVASLLVASASEAARVVVEYRPGTTAEVLVNGYRLGDGAGAFAVADGESAVRTCFCVEAHTNHSTAGGAYQRARNAVDSAALDALLFIQSRGVPGVSADDVAIATQLLGYHYAGARRRGGGAIWFDHTTARAISPTAPIRWDELPPISATSPVGVRIGGGDRDDLEALILTLDLAARSNIGPWTVSPLTLDRSTGRASVTVRGAAGPITAIDVARWRIQDHDGAEVRSATTSAVDGIVVLDGVDLPVGGTLTVEVDAPRPHIEYAGHGVQRLACAERQRLRRTLRVEPQPRHVEVHKTADHPALSVAGTTIALLDGAGTEIDRVVLDASGTATFAPIDPTRSPSPYALRELVAAPGLIAAAGSHPLPPLAELSTDRSAPTTIEVENEAARSTVRLRKALDEPELAAGLDLAGFEFEVAGPGRDTVVVVTTDSTGRSPEIDLVMGDYVVTEVGRPGWAVPLIDDGPRTFTVGPAPTASEWRYENRLPPVEIDTSARDADGRDVVAVPGAVVDEVTYDGLLPGAEYVSSAEIQLVDAAGQVTSSGLSGSTTFTPELSSGTVAVRIEVPDDAALAGASGVVFQTLRLADNGAVVAIHHDPGATSQTVRFEPLVAPSTSTSSAAPAPSSTVAVTTTVAPTTHPPPTASPSTAAELPRTGAGTGGQLAIVVLLVAIGAALVELGRRRASDPEA